MSSGGVFSETLQSITTTKLIELSKKRSVFEEQKKSLIQVAQAEQDQKKRLRILVDGVKRSFGVKTAKHERGGRRGGPGRIIIGSTSDPRLDTMLKNMERFLEQARYDPSISAKLLQDWESSLLQQLDVQALKYQYATLYGELVTEWLSSEQKVAEVDNQMVQEDDFEEFNLRKEEKEAGRVQWESLVFESLETDHKAIAAYLQDLFGNSGTNRQAIKALDDLRKSIETLENTLANPGQFNSDNLKSTIRGLLASDLLTEEKRAALKDFLASPIILTEVADVLNMRMAAIDDWSWELEGLPVEQRRHVNGKYHIYIDEDLLQAIFLQFIGVKWCVCFKHAFTVFSKFEGTWASLRTPAVNQKRREFFLGPQVKKPSAQSKRQGIYKSIYFMSQLPSSENELQEGAEGEEEANYDMHVPPRHATQFSNRAVSMAAPQQPPIQMQQASTMRARSMRQSAPMARRTASRMYNINAEVDDDNDEEDKPSSPMETKQYLLHLLATEIIVSTRLQGEFTCSRSEFESWGPSLPHSTVHAVLSFFGLSPRWLRFFRKFLEAPLKFSEDGAFTTPRTRRRGAPGAHSLSLACGEAILFCLDYAVNQKAEGTQLYRMHDDFWVWNSSHQTVVKAWGAITEFSDVMGVTLNEKKTGTVRITKDKTAAPIDKSLPEGEIRWGFLLLDPITGRFTIDQGMVDAHIMELQQQLSDKKSIFSWIQAWNSYAGRFFTSNFGKPCNAFGRAHVDSMLSSLERVQRQIFSDTTVVEYLKNTLQERFGIQDVPDGYLYFPSDLGGLELHNPFIGLVQLRDSVFENPEGIMDDFFEAEQDAYRQAKRRWDSGKGLQPGSITQTQAQIQRDQMMAAQQQAQMRQAELMRQARLMQQQQQMMGQYQLQGPQLPRIQPPVAQPNTASSYKEENEEEFMGFEEWVQGREEYSQAYDGNLYDVLRELLQKPNVEGVDGVVQEGGIWTGDEYWKWVAMLYGEDMRGRFGGLDVVDKGLLPIGMVSLLKSGKVKW